MYQTRAPMSNYPYYDPQKYYVFLHPDIGHGVIYKHYELASVFPFSLCFLRNYSITLIQKSLLIKSTIGIYNIVPCISYQTSFLPFSHRR